MKSSPRVPQLEKACAQQQRPNTAKKKKKKKKVLKTGEYLSVTQLTEANTDFAAQ